MGEVNSTTTALTPTTDLYITEAEVKARLKTIEARRFDIKKKPKYEKACFSIVDKATVSHRVGNFGHLGVVTGPFGSRKTTVITAIAAAAISGYNVLGFEFDLAGKNVLVIDTEQPEDTHYETMSKIYDMAGFEKGAKVDNLYCYSLKPFNWQERLLYTDILIKNTPNIGLVIVDGIVDLINSINDEVASRHMLDRIALWTDELSAMLITVIHTNKDGVNERGFIGGFLADKANFIIKTVHSDEKKRTLITCRKSRYGIFPAFGISHNKFGIPISDFDELPC